MLHTAEPCKTNEISQQKCCRPEQCLDIFKVIKRKKFPAKNTLSKVIIQNLRRERVFQTSKS